MGLTIQFRRLALKSPPLGPKWDRWAKKLGCASDPPIPADCRLEDRMRTRVFSSTYPNWALVGGTSRPAGETVCGEMRNEIRDRIWCKWRAFLQAFGFYFLTPSSGSSLVSKVCSRSFKGSILISRLGKESGFLITPNKLSPRKSILYVKISLEGKIGWNATNNNFPSGWV